jgi:hypothetical protein
MAATFDSGSPYQKLSRKVKPLRFDGNTLDPMAKAGSRGRTDVPRPFLKALSWHADVGDYDVQPPRVAANQLCS